MKKLKKDEGQISMSCSDPDTKNKVKGPDNCKGHPSKMTGQNVKDLAYDKEEYRRELVDCG
jgi:hypothetical protein